jgi:hypothetical protein
LRGNPDSDAHPDALRNGEAHGHPKPDGYVHGKSDRSPYANDSPGERRRSDAEGGPERS